MLSPVATDAPADSSPTGNRRNELTLWWRRRTLRARLSLLVAGAVAVAVLGLAGLAWAAVGHILADQLEAEVSTDARAIAAQPDQWRTAYSPLPDAEDPPHADDDGGHSGPHVLGPRWQILDARGAVVSDSMDALPVSTGARQVAAATRSQVREQVEIGDDSFLMLTMPASGGGAVQVAVDQGDATRTQRSFGLLLAACCAAGVLGAGLVLKHAPSARHTTVRLTFEPDQIDVEVTNDDPAPKTPSHAIPGHGLVGMRERAAVYGGQVSAGRGNDGSWRVSTRLRPYDHVTADDARRDTALG